MWVYACVEDYEGTDHFIRFKISNGELPDEIRFLGVLFTNSGEFTRGGWPIYT